MIKISDLQDGKYITFNAKGFQYVERFIIAKNLDFKVILGFSQQIKHQVQINYPVVNSDYKAQIISIDGNIMGYPYNISTNSFPNILLLYSNVFDFALRDILLSHYSYDIEIELEDYISLPKLKAYLLNQQEMEMLKEYLNENLKKGFIKRSNLKFAFHLFFVKKKGFKACPYRNYQSFNAITKKNHYLIPKAEILTDQPKDVIIFSKVDLKSAFN